MIVVAALALTLSAPPRPAQADNSTGLTELVDAAAQRLQVADPVAAFKWHNNEAVQDPVRVQQELSALSAYAVAAGVDFDYVTTVFTDQIDATEAVEYSRFARWKLDPAGVPVAFTDLSVSRATIDNLNEVIVDQIRLRWDSLHSPACLSELDNARRQIISARGLDGLYPEALSFATHSYCQSTPG